MKIEAEVLQTGEEIQRPRHPPSHSLNSKPINISQLTPIVSQKDSYRLYKLDKETVLLLLDNFENVISELESCLRG